MTRSLFSTGTSSFAGVCWSKSAAKWEARLSHGGKRHSLGYFAEKRDAAAAVQAAREAAAEGRLDSHLAERREAVASGLSSNWKLLYIHRLISSNLRR